MRVGQIGVGYWGPNILRNLVANQDIDVVAVADRDAERLAVAARICPSATLTSDAADILMRVDLEAVVVATPAGSHFKLAWSALDQGKHVLVEKPMALTTKEASQLARMADKRNLVLMVGHTFVYNPAVLKLKELIDDGALGELRYIYSQRLNLGRIRSDVDALWNLAPHDISIVQYLLDEAEPIEVNRHGMAYIQPGIEDVAFLHLVYPNHVMAHIHVSWLDPHKVRRLTLVGTDRMAVYDDLSENKIALFDKGIDRIAQLGVGMDFDEGGFELFRYRSGDVLLPAVPTLEPLKVEIDHWVDCVLNGVPCKTGPQHAQAVIRILEKASVANARPSRSDSFYSGHLRTVERPPGGNHGGPTRRDDQR